MTATTPQSTEPHGSTGTPYGTLPSASPLPQRKPVSLPRLAEMRKQGEKITMLTAYDATFAAVADAAGVECILVGDSLGMVSQGQSSTASVTLEHMIYHTECVVRGLRRVQATAWVLADLPLGAYHESKEQALRNAVQLLQVGAHMIKLEGGGWTTEIVAFLVERGIPVCAHLGLTPQTVHALGGYRVQGRQEKDAQELMQHAQALEQAGASMLVLEMVPAPLATQITEALPLCHTIGIGAGNGCAGQVLVMHDMLGINLGKNPKFVRNFMDGASSVREAMQHYVEAVKGGFFPDNNLHAW